MPQSITLGTRTFKAARLRRTGGTLSYNDELIPAGSYALLGHALSGVASLVLDDGRLTSVFVDEITSATFELIADIASLDAQRALLAAVKQEVIVGEPLRPVRGMVIRRTGRPFMSVHERYAPHDGDLTVEAVDRTGVWYNGPDFRLSHFQARYATTGYFTVVSW